MSEWFVDLPEVTLCNGDVLSISWWVDGESAELLDYRVTPEPVREAAEVAALEQELEGL